MHCTYKSHCTHWDHIIEKTFYFAQDAKNWPFPLLGEYTSTQAAGKHTGSRAQHLSLGSFQQTQVLFADQRPVMRLIVW